MKRKRLIKLRDELHGLRRAVANVRHADVRRVAEALGREEENRGKEPTFVSDWLSVKALTIPHHPGTLSKRVALSVIDQLLDDIDEWFSRIEQEGVGDDENSDE
jgi:hypothetical protein